MPLSLFASRNKITDSLHYRNNNGSYFSRQRSTRSHRLIHRHKGVWSTLCSPVRVLSLLLSIVGLICLVAHRSVFNAVRQLRTVPPVPPVATKEPIVVGPTEILQVRDDVPKDPLVRTTSLTSDSLHQHVPKMPPLSGDDVIKTVTDESADTVRATLPPKGTVIPMIPKAETPVIKDVPVETTTDSKVKPNVEPILSIPRAEYSTDADFVEHRKVVEAALKKDKDVLRRVISAYVEPPLQDTIPNTGSRGDLKDDKDAGTPPKFVIPLPRRNHTPADLKKFAYPAVRTCNDMPGKFPIDRGLEIDPETGAANVWNVGDEPTPPDFAELEAPYCPVELDPFLPWIHDVFPSQDGQSIEFIAQNKRRCRTGKKDTENVNRLIPQVALMQAISVERLTDEQARQLAPDLWHPDAADTVSAPRYRLAPYDEASPDGMFTRFICRFHLTNVVGGASVSIVVGETLSEYPFNYELVSYRKQQRSLLTPKGKDTRMFWASNLHFSCPLPKGNVALQTAVAMGTTVLSDGSPTLFVDLVPIRTSVRYEELHLTESMIGPKGDWSLPAFDAHTRWGKDNVLPLVEASSRWTNIPVCRPPELVDQVTVSEETELDTFESTQITRKLVPEVASLPKKPHFLSACLWASTEFKTRGRDRGASTDTLSRLQEWIEFHLLVGFDHFYVYDNSGAHTNVTTLQPVLDMFPGKVTRVDWPSTVCNNNIPAHDSTGERSSQYAAENSCRSRYGPFTEWMAAFDTDEYFVPMGNYTSLKDVLVDVGKRGTNILSLRSSRGRLRMDKSDVVGSNEDAREQSPSTTFLEAYNCDSAGSPKPTWAERARKQIYRPDYVLYHYVHYSTVTKGYLKTYEEATKEGSRWVSRYGETKPSEHTSDEISEVVMLHTKSIQRDLTYGYETQCRQDYAKKWQGCWVAYPWPDGIESKNKDEAQDKGGMAYNCFVNTKVDEVWVPKLRDAMAKRKKR